MDIDPALGDNPHVLLLTLNHALMDNVGYVCESNTWGTIRALIRGSTSSNLPRWP